MSTQYDIVVMGDITLDWYCQDLLPFAFSELDFNGVVVPSQISELPGGSGLLFAKFAQQLGYRPVLLGRVGNDLPGKVISDWLVSNRLGSSVTVDPILSTGKVFIVYDQNRIRLLMVNRPNANQSLSVTDIETNQDLITSSQLLYVSGYCVAEPEASRTYATLRAMQIARSGSCKIAFDVVPHHIYRNLEFSQFRDLIGEIDILISEVATIRGLLRLGKHGEKIDRALAEKTAAGLMGLFDSFILRYGPTGLEQQLVWSSNSRDLTWEETKIFRSTDDRGFGDWLSVRTLKEVFRIGG